MAKLLYMPFSIVAGLLAGLLGRKLSERVWEMFDEEEPLNPKQRDVPASKMVVGLAIQAAIFTAVRSAMDHYARRTYMRMTGSWPGEEEPEQE